jgi:hypothetical protein
MSHEPLWKSAKSDKSVDANRICQHWRHALVTPISQGIVSARTHYIGWQNRFHGIDSRQIESQKHLPPKLFFKYLGSCGNKSENRKRNVKAVRKRTFEKDKNFAGNVAITTLMLFKTEIKRKKNSHQILHNTNSALLSLYIVGSVW